MTLADLSAHLLQGILPGHPFRPQLCWRSFRDLEKVAEHATERIEEDPIAPSYNSESVGPCALPLPSEFLVEMKMDGERVRKAHFSARWV